MKPNQGKQNAAGMKASTIHCDEEPSLDFAKQEVQKEMDPSTYATDYPNVGYCLIFNHYKFDGKLYLKDRTNAQKDEDGLTKLFSNFGFTVKAYNDLTVKETMDIIHEFAYDVDHSKSSCFVLWFLSHGQRGQIYARDNIFDVNWLFTHFTAESCVTLASKPKLFFIQACRGDEYDTAFKVNKPALQTDSGIFDTYSIPPQVDFLVCYSTIAGHYSWKNKENGSWFVFSLIKIFQEKCDYEDVANLLVCANRYMVVNFESKCQGNSDLNGIKQTSYTCSTLMRKLYLRPKRLEITHVPQPQAQPKYKPHRRYPNQLVQLFKRFLRDKK